MAERETWTQSYGPLGRFPRSLHPTGEAVRNRNGVVRVRVLLVKLNCTKCGCHPLGRRSLGIVGPAARNKSSVDASKPYVAVGAFR